ncbi:MULTISPECIES: phage tail sheath family protein [Streptomyces]|uniref:Phage tail sheath family protein n=2 Tax=Streptomyces TaxID=1883 RepID=A0ABV9IJV0_9ACTN
MPEYLSPGVYVEEISTGPRPITGVATSTAGMVGVTARGPDSGKPKLVTSLLEFHRLFGGFLPEPDSTAVGVADGKGIRWWLLPLAVKGFFDNGGQRLYVKRVPPAQGSTAAKKVIDDGTGSESSLVLSATARQTGEGGDGLTALLRLARGASHQVVAPDPNPEPAPGPTPDPAPAPSPAPGPNPAPAPDAAGGPAPGPDPAPAPDPTPAADPAGGPAGGPDPAGGEGPGPDPAPAPAPDPAAAVTLGALGAIKQFSTVLLVPAHPGKPLGLYTVQSHAASGTNVTVTLDRPLAQPAVKGDALVLVQGFRLEIIDESPGVPRRSLLLPPASRPPAPDLTVLATTVNGEPDALLTLEVGEDPLPHLGTGLSRTDPTKPMDVLKLGGGCSAGHQLTAADYIGVDGGSGNRTGIQALEDIDEVAICAVPGVWDGTVLDALTTHCTLLGERFAVFDARPGATLEEIKDFRASLPSTDRAALYHPWVRVPNPDPRATGPVEAAPSGHLLGIYADTDVRRGVHKAPANTVVRGIVPGTGLVSDITRREQDTLNPDGINVLRAFPNLGQRVWGARTLADDTRWRYVSVRRLFLFIEESLDEGLQWVVFEANSEQLWAAVRQSIESFLTGVWRGGALAGSTAAEAFYVVCDRTTMTEDDLAQGRLVCQVGIAPVYPAEFVIVRVQQATRESITT